MQLQKIDIDWDIHKLIEAERKGFDEPQYVALRRLLNMPPPELRTEESPRPGSGIPWVEDGVKVPHGSVARMQYQRGKQRYEGKFFDGNLVIGDKAFGTLSAAANALAVTKGGGKTQLNGWNYWEAKFPGEAHWRSLKEMRDNVRDTSA